MPILLLFFSLLTSFISSENPQLTIEIRNIEVIEGNIRIGIFNTSEKFLKQGFTFKNYLVAASDTIVSIVIDDLPEGEYAFLLYHDKNSDGKMNQNFIGIPKEPYGFSNNIKPKFSAPSYKDCMILLDEDKTIRVKLLR